MVLIANIYLFRSTKTKGLFCFSMSREADGLPVSLSPWRRFGVVTPTEKLPHGLTRAAVEGGIAANGYQLYRHKPKTSN